LNTAFSAALDFRRMGKFAVEEHMQSKLPYLMKEQITELHKYTILPAREIKSYIHKHQNADKQKIIQWAKDRFSWLSEENIDRLYRKSFKAVPDKTEAESYNLRDLLVRMNYSGNLI
jgi:hypothetical protein